MCLNARRIQPGWKPGCALLLFSNLLLLTIISVQGDYQILNIKDHKNKAGTMNLYGGHINSLQIAHLYLLKCFNFLILQERDYITLGASDVSAQYLLQFIQFIFRDVVASYSSSACCTLGATSSWSNTYLEIQNNSKAMISFSKFSIMQSATS